MIPLKYLNGLKPWVAAISLLQGESKALNCSLRNFKFMSLQKIEVKSTIGAVMRLMPGSSNGSFKKD